MDPTSPPPEVPLEPTLTHKSPIRPLTFAGLLLLVFVGALTLNFFTEGGPDITVIDRGAEKLTELGDTRIYVNQTYGIEMQIPAGWEFDQSDTDYFVEAQALDFGCSVGFMPDSVGLFMSLENTAESLKDTILTENPNFQFLEQKDTTLSGAPAVEVSFAADVDGVTVLQDYLLTLRGSTMYAIILTKAEVFQEACADDFESIRAGIVIPE